MGYGRGGMCSTYKHDESDEDQVQKRFRYQVCYSRWSVNQPNGMAERYVFRFQEKFFAVRVNIVEKANYQLLLGTEFMVATGVALFPRWNRIVVTNYTREVGDRGLLYADISYAARGGSYEGRRSG